MIKFFRNIRQNLIIENKTGKYLKYAIGEIVLVVIGILIALQINNWNEARKENIELLQYKQRLLRQFQIDSASLWSFNQGYKYVKPIFDGLDSTFRENLKGNVKLDSIIKIPVFITLQSDFISSTHALDELNNTGKMSLFKNDTIKDKLAEYQNLINQQHDIISRTKNKYDDFDKLLHRISKFGERDYLVLAKDINQDAFMNEYWIIEASRKGQRMVFDEITKTNHEILKLLHK